MPSMCYGGLGIRLDNPADSMYRIKNIFDKNTGKQAEHFILAFNKREQSTLVIPFIREIAYDMASLLYYKGVDSVSISQRLGHAQVYDCEYLCSCDGKSGQA